MDCPEIVPTAGLVIVNTTTTATLPDTRSPWWGQWGRDLVELCVADPETLRHWLTDENRKLVSCAAWMVVGAGLYGASIGLWRAPLQSLFVAIKFPLLIAATTILNALLNGMLAKLLGLPISFRQCVLAIMISFALLSVILGALTPLSLFVLYNLPAMGSADAGVAHAAMIVTHVIVIATAGLIANLRLYRLLSSLCGNSGQASRVLSAWLAGNMFLGCQLSYNLRPFFGTPDLEVAFLRDNPFDGSFYEALYHLVLRLTAG